VKLETDAGRWHGFDAALAEHEDLLDVYPPAGYAVKELPRLPVRQRTDWLEARIASEEAA
jgi:predicted ATPase